jgi:hypothetical protein
MGWPEGARKYVDLRIWQNADGTKAAISAPQDHTVRFAVPAAVSSPHDRPDRGYLRQNADYLIILARLSILDRLAGLPPEIPTDTEQEGADIGGQCSRWSGMGASRPFP